MNIEIQAALIGAVVATLGSWIFAAIQDFYKTKKERENVANLLFVELMAQAEFVYVLADATRMKDALALKETFVRFVPPEPIMYHALAGKIGLLKLQTSSAVVAYYGTISWAKTIIEALPDTITYASIKAQHNSGSTPEFHSANAEKLLAAQAAGLMERLRQASRGACFNAILAIRSLEKVAAYKRLPNDETVLADMLRKLEQGASQ
jgi:hypothetical protein